MGKTLKIDGNNGRVSITTTGVDAAITDPLNHTNDVFFHTDLPYLQVKQTVGPTTVTLNSVARSYYTWSDSGGCGGGCFITSAAVDIMGLEDDCEELTSLRWFRDTYMLSDGEKAAKVAEYYFMGPLIVNALQKQDDYTIFMEMLFNTFIIPAVKLLEELEYEKAEELYESMFITAKSKAGL